MKPFGHPRPMRGVALVSNHAQCVHNTKAWKEKYSVPSSNLRALQDLNVMEPGYDCGKQLTLRRNRW
eukprot:22623-Amphidinium_carterae.1